MIFSRVRKKIFLGICFLFMSCGLKIGEKPPVIPVYKFQMNQNDLCSSLDYQEELIKYFFSSTKLNSHKLGQILECLSDQVSAVKDLFHNEYLTKEDIIIILENDWIDLGNLKPFLIKVLKSRRDEKILFFKKHFIQFISSNSKLDLKAKDLCLISERIQKNSENLISEPKKNEALISKSDVDVFLNFLKEFYELLFFIEDKSKYLFRWFFYETSSDKEAFFDNKDKFRNFIFFLQDVYSEKFSNYSNFLRSHSKAMSERYPRGYEKFLEEMIHITQSFDLSLEDETVHVLDIKYMFIVIEAMRFFFQVYDLNQNSIIDSQELKPVSCLLEGLVFLFLPDLLKKLELEEPIKKRGIEFAIKNNVLTTRDITRYMLNYQKIPDNEMDLEDIYNLFVNEEIKSLSVREVSRLILLFFNIVIDEIESLDSISEFRNKEMEENKKNKSTDEISN
ncbi:MAG: hypothetical protein GDA46_02510 [Bdellovibrionales bacterium]|nr:hypothetical protein [Bdellovibrionales bacterium]